MAVTSSNENATSGKQSTHRDYITRSFQQATPQKPVTTFSPEREEQFAWSVTYTTPRMQLQRSRNR